jgi:hypothetical protein
MSTKDLMDTSHKNKNRVAKSNYIAKVKHNLCTGCALCAKKCPLKAIIIKKEKARVDPKKCDGCGICIIICTTEAIKLNNNNKKNRKN